jgi:hypothetical protein
MIEIILRILTKYWKWILIVILFIICFFAIRDLLNKRKILEQYKNNSLVLGSLNDTLRDKNGILQQQQNDLVLRLGDAKKMAESGNIEIKKLFNELQASKIKEKQTITMSNITVSALYHFRPDLVDSLRRVDTLTYIVDSTKKLTESFSNEWITYKRFINDKGQPDIVVSTKNDIMFYKSWYREGFILFRWLKPKQYKYTVKDRNPYSTISKFIIIDLGKINK